MLVIAVFSHIVRDNPFNNRHDRFWWHQLMTWFNYHGKNLRHFVFVVWGQISKQVRIKTKDLNFVSTNHSWDKSQHIKFYLIFVIWFLKFRKQFLSKSSWVINRINRKEISTEFNQAFSCTFSFNLLNSSIQPFLTILGHLWSFSLFKKCNFIHAFITRLGIAFIIIIQNQEELTGRHHNLCILIMTCLGNSIHSFLIIPNFSFVKFNHNI